MEYRDYIAKLTYGLPGLGIYESSSKLIQILFLKSILDDANKYEYLDMEGMKTMFEFSKCFNDNSVDEDILYKTFRAVEKANRVYGNALTSAAISYRFYFEKENQKRINDMLRSFNLPSSYDERRDLIEYLLNVSGINGGRYTSEYLSSPTIINLSSELLEINENDKVLNTFAGCSSFALKNKNYKWMSGFDINMESIATSYMIKVFCKLDNFEVNQCDIYEDFDDNKRCDRKYNKIFTDGPLGARIRTIASTNPNSKYYGIKDGDILNIRKTFDFLDDNGLAVITVPNRVFVSGSKAYADLRKDLSTSGVKAIISLPNNIMYGTTIPMNLLVVEKGYSGEVIIIKAEDEGFYESTRIMRNITQFGIANIFKVYKNFEQVEGFSHIVLPTELFGDGSDPVQLQKFFFVEEKKNHRKIDEIDNDISDIMSKLANLNK